MAPGAPSTRRSTPRRSRPTPVRAWANRSRAPMSTRCACARRSVVQATDTTCPWGCGMNGTAHCQGARAIRRRGSAERHGRLGCRLGDAPHARDAPPRQRSDRSGHSGLRHRRRERHRLRVPERRRAVPVRRFHDPGARFTGPQPQPPVVLVSTGSIAILGPIDGQGPCGGGNGGPGGFPAGHGGDTAGGSGGGTGATDSTPVLAVAVTAGRRRGRQRRCDDDGRRWCCVRQRRDQPARRRWRWWWRPPAATRSAAVAVVRSSSSRTEPS